MRAAGVLRLSSWLPIKELTAAAGHLKNQIARSIDDLLKWCFSHSSQGRGSVTEHCIQLPLPQ